MTDPKKKTQVLITYSIIFYGIWTLFELLIKPEINTMSNQWLAQVLKSGIIKNLVWTLPTVLLILRFRDNVYIPLGEMFKTRVNWLRYLPVFAGFTVYILVAGYITNGRIALSPDFEPQNLIIVLFVGITEETVFRGWLLNTTVKENSGKKYWLAVTINALMFLAIHFPSWLHEGIFLANFLNLGFLCILALSVIFSHAFVRSRSIILPIFLHMYWDLLMFLFV